MNVISCGILEKEIDFLKRKNDWDWEVKYLCSSLHIDFEALEKSMKKAVAATGDKPLIIYGTCHPRIDSFYESRKGVRIEAQNCIEMLLGKEDFQFHMERGAFFLLEDWVKRWDLISSKTFGSSGNMRREIFRDHHRYFLALETPCSGDFLEMAEEISRRISIPLKRLKVDLEKLEKSISKAMSQVRKG